VVCVLLSVGVVHVLWCVFYYVSVFYMWCVRVCVCGWWAVRLCMCGVSICECVSLGVCDVGVCDVWYV